jgi:hypothetical protein
MYDLMDRYFAGMSPALFRADLQEKHWVILLTDAGDGRVVGFSTQTAIEARADGGIVRALFSGDTIVDRAYWGQTELMRVWGELALRLIDSADGVPLYWFLICMGYRTYRFLPVFFREFHPRPDRETPAHSKQVLDAVASARYGADYCPRSGVVRMRDRSVRLREGVADIDDRLLGNRFVRFFVDRNPGHRSGDELACIAPLTRENFTPLAWRMINGKRAGRDLARP